MQSIKVRRESSELIFQPSTMMLQGIYLCILLAIIPLSQQGCSVQVQKDVNDINLVGKGTCLNKQLKINLKNEYRGYCSGSCYSFHYAHTAFSKISLRTCVPVPDTSGEYKVVRHTRYNATCDSGNKWELVDIEYVNATTCKCKKVLEKYVST